VADRRQLLNRAPWLNNCTTSTAIVSTTDVVVGLRAMKVLIIEPDVAHAGSLAGIIRALGHEPIICSDPKAAVKSADQCSPAVILLGLSIRGLDVYQYARLLRNQDDLAQVKIIAVSGEVDDPQRARAAGIDTELLQHNARGLLPVLRESLFPEAHSSGAV